MCEHGALQETVVSFRVYPGCVDEWMNAHFCVKKYKKKYYDCINISGNKILNVKIVAVDKVNTGE